MFGNVFSSGFWEPMSSINLEFLWNSMGIVLQVMCFILSLICGLPYGPLVGGLSLVIMLINTFQNKVIIETNDKQINKGNLHKNN